MLVTVRVNSYLVGFPAPGTVTTVERTPRVEGMIASRLLTVLPTPPPEPPVVDPGDQGFDDEPADPPADEEPVTAPSRKRRSR